MTASRASSLSSLDALRGYEVEAVKHRLPAGTSVLEIGGGSGLQAAIIASWGCRVESIDLADRGSDPSPYFPVKDYDGRTFPFLDASFDAVFSSNVLEHVRDLPFLFAEIKRVLKPSGIAIHIVPTSTWRLWTSLAHYVYIPRYLINLWRGRSQSLPTISETVAGRGKLFLLRRALLPTPHGELGSATAELLFFSRKRWRDTFERAGFEIDHEGGNGFFYTGYGLSRLSPAQRSRLARVLGSSCHVFCMRPAR